MKSIVSLVITDPSADGLRIGNRQIEAKIPAGKLGSISVAMMSLNFLRNESGH